MARRAYRPSRDIKTLNDVESKLSELGIEEGRIKDMAYKVVYCQRSTIPQSTRIQIYKQDNYTCKYCHQQYEVKQLTIDHILPVEKGGGNEPYNLVTACEDCNRKKHTCDAEDFVALKTIEKVFKNKFKSCKYMGLKKNGKEVRIICDFKKFIQELL